MDFTKRVNKEGLQSLLTKKSKERRTRQPWGSCRKAVKRERKAIFHKDDVPPMNNQSQIHAVCLKMISGGLVALKVKDATKVGTEKLNGAHLCVVCPNANYAKNGNTLCAPAYLRDECWKGFNLN